MVLNIARGITALHRCGVKSQNVLIFNRPSLYAKVADFSHLVLDTGEKYTLVGGTQIYSAPEWGEPVPTTERLKTDVYLYGLVFANLSLGSSLESHIQLHP